MASSTSTTPLLRSQNESMRPRMRTLPHRLGRQDAAADRGEKMRQTRLLSSDGADDGGGGGRRRG